MLIMTLILSAVGLFFALALGFRFVRDRRREFADAKRLCDLALSTARDGARGAPRAEASHVLRGAQ